MSNFFDEIMNEYFTYTHCQYNSHKMKFSHTCIYQKCHEIRIGCQKCIHDQHYHNMPLQSHYWQYIQEIVQFQTQQYDLYEAHLKKLRRIDNPTLAINQCIELIQLTQDKHINNFLLSEKRFDQQIYNLISSSLIQLHDNSIQDDYKKIYEKLQLIHESGLIMVEENKQIEHQQFQLEVQDAIKQIYFRVNKSYIYEDSKIINLILSPNEEFLACQDKYQFNIFIIQSHKQIKNKKINRLYFKFSFTEDSKFYFYSDKYYIYLEGLKNSQKTIIRLKNISDSMPFMIFPFNFHEVLINGDGKYFSIIDVQNRQINNIVTALYYSPIHAFDYNYQNQVIVCAMINKIQFYCKKTQILLFQKQLISNLTIDKNQVRFLQNSSKIVIGNNKEHFLCLVNYQKKQLYFIKKFNSGNIQQLYTIINFRYTIILTDQDIVILDENFKITQKLKISQNRQTQRNVMQNPKQMLVCKSDKIELIKYIYKWQDIVFKL